MLCAFLREALHYYNTFLLADPEFVPANCLDNWTKVCNELKPHTELLVIVVATFFAYFHNVHVWSFRKKKKAVRLKNKG